MSYYLAVLKKYATFSGRARRKEYWMFALFNYLFVLVFTLIDYILRARTGVFTPFTFIYGFAMILPGIAVSVRRMHDLDKSGAWILIPLIPIIGGIWYFVLAVTRGTDGPNQYGEDPYEE